MKKYKKLFNELKPEIDTIVDARKNQKEAYNNDDFEVWTYYNDVEMCALDEIIQEIEVAYHSVPFKKTYDQGRAAFWKLFDLYMIKNNVYI